MQRNLGTRIVGDSTAYPAYVPAVVLLIQYLQCMLFGIWLSVSSVEYLLCSLQSVTGFPTNPGIMCVVTLLAGFYCQLVLGLRSDNTFN